MAAQDLKVPPAAAVPPIVLSGPGQTPPASSILVSTPGSAFSFGKTRLSDVSASKGIVAVVHGESGNGKTSLLHGFPPDRTTIFDIDGGAGVLLDRGWNGSVEPASEDLSNLKAWVEWVTTAKHGFTTVVVDSVTNLERRMVFLIGDKRNKEFVSVSEYGDASSKMRSYLLALRDLSEKGINVVFIAHTKTDVKGQEGVKQPFLSDKLSIELPGLVDLCGYLGVDPSGNRFLQFVPAPNVRAKTRFSCVKAYEELNLASIFARVYKDRRERVESLRNPAPAPTDSTETTKVVESAKKEAGK